MGKTGDAGIMYRAYEHLGLRLTSMDHYKASQLVKAQLLKHSVDESVRKVWQAKEDKEAKMTRHFKVSQLSTAAAAQVKLDLQYPRQLGDSTRFRRGKANGARARVGATRCVDKMMRRSRTS